MTATALVFIPLGAFAVCCVMQGWFQYKVRAALKARHPETLLAAERSSMLGSGIWNFVRDGSYEQLEDTDLNRHVHNWKTSLVVAVASWICILIVGVAFSEGPGLPIATANGSYVNDCCGTLNLTNGHMEGMDMQASYSVEHDKVGAYVLPSVYVGASEQGLIVDRSHYPLMLRLDDEEHPHSIELVDDTNGSVFTFHRVVGH